MLHFKVSILNRCNLRKDAWATEVERRVSGCIDLVASDAVYHDTCKTQFFSDKSLSAKVDIFKTPEQKKLGCPQNNEMQASFKHLCQWLEEQTELYTVAELYDKICSMSECQAIYSIKWLKQQLADHYKNFIFFTNEPGRSNIVCFRDMTGSILSEK